MASEPLLQGAMEVVVMVEATDAELVEVSIAVTDEVRIAVPAVEMGESWLDGHGQEATIA